MAQVGQQVRWPLPLRRSNRRRCPDSRAKAVLEASRARVAREDKVCQAVSRGRGCLVDSRGRGCLVDSRGRGCLAVSKAKVAPADKACLVGSRGRMVSRGCLVVRVVPVVSKARAARELRMAPRRRGLRTQLQRRRQQRVPLKTLAPRILIPRLSNEELRVGVLVAAMASGHPYFFS